MVIAGRVLNHRSLIILELLLLVVKKLGVEDFLIVRSAHYQSSIVSHGKGGWKGSLVAQQLFNELVRTDAVPQVLQVLKDLDVDLTAMLHLLAAISRG